MMIDDARIDRIIREMSDALAAMPDPGFEGAPTLRAQKAERRRVAQAQIDEINSTHASVTKFTTNIDRARETCDLVVEKIADCRRRAAASATDAERGAWLDGAAWLEGAGGFYEMPGAIIALSRELGRASLPSLPTITTQLAEAEADLQPHLERLLGALDAWDASARTVATATMTADLPNVEADATATVK